MATARNGMENGAAWRRGFLLTVALPVLASTVLAEELPDHRPAIDRTAIEVKTISAVNPWFPLDFRRWNVTTPDRPTLFGVVPPKGELRQVHELERKPAGDERRRILIKQYEKEVALAEQCNVDALMIESLANGKWWEVTPLFMQAADNVKSKTRIGIFLTGTPPGKTPEEKRQYFVLHIKRIVEECDRHESVWRINGKPVVMLYFLVPTFSPDTWAQIQAELDAEGKDCIWFMSSHHVSIDKAKKYLPVMDGVAHYACYGLGGFKEKIAESLIPWMHEHYPQKLIYPGVEQNYAQSWSFAGGGSGLTQGVRGMCQAALSAGVDGLHFTNWSDCIENSRIVPSEMGDRVLAEIVRHYRWLLHAKDPRDERDDPLFALSYLDSQVHGQDLKFEFLSFPCRAGSSGKVRMTLWDENGKIVSSSPYKQFSTAKLSEVRFQFKSTDWPYHYTLTPVAEIMYSDGSNNERTTLRGPYMIIGADRQANNLARSVCSSSVLPLKECSVIKGEDSSGGTHRLQLNVSSEHVCAEVRLVRNGHVVKTWKPKARNWQEGLTLQRGPVGYRAADNRLLPGVPPFDIYHLEVWSRDERRAWSAPLVLKNMPLPGDATTVLGDGTEFSAPKNAFIVSCYSFDALVGKLVPDEGGFDYHGALGGGTLNGKSRWYGYFGSPIHSGVFSQYYGGQDCAPALSDGGVDGSRCLEFDGQDDFIFFGANILPCDSWTIAAWVSPAEQPGKQFMWSTRMAGMDAYLDEQNRPAIRGWTHAGGWETATAQNSLSLNSWHHIASTYDCRTMRLFVDGKQVGTVTPKEKVRAALPCLMVGCQLSYTGKRGQFFKGKMDNLFVAGRALGEHEIAALVQ